MTWRAWVRAATQAWRGRPAGRGGGSARAAAISRGTADAGLSAGRARWTATRPSVVGGASSARSSRGIRWTPGVADRAAPDRGTQRVHLVHGAGGPLGWRRAGPSTSGSEAGATLAVRSAGATIVQPGRGPEPARWDFGVAVGAGASLDWAPEPTVVTDGADYRTSLRVELAAGGAGRAQRGRRARPPRRCGRPLPRASRRDRRRRCRCSPTRRRSTAPTPRCAGRVAPRVRAPSERSSSLTAACFRLLPTIRGRASDRTCGGPGRTWPGRAGRCSPSASRAP